MPDTDVKDMALESSTSTESTSDVTPATGAKADSSPAGGSEETLLSVVRDVVRDKEEEPEAASPAEGGEKGSEPEVPEPESEAKPADEEDYSSEPFAKHPRFRKLLQEVKTHKQDATRYRNIQKFLETHAIPDEEAAQAFNVLAQIKSGQYHEAWKTLRPIVEELLVRSGEILPPEIEQRVQQGELSRQAAYELSTTKARAEAVERQRAFEREMEGRRTYSERVHAVQEAAVNWIADRRLKDPDFEAKEEALEREIVWLQSREGRPDSPQGVRAQLAKAYKAVNEQLRPAPVIPGQKPAVRPITGGSVSGNSRPEPKSMLDVIRQTVGGA